VNYFAERSLIAAALLIAACACFAATVHADPLPPAWEKQAVESVDDLVAIQTQLKAALPAAKASTVGVRAGRGSGSGVIVSEDGYVLTAAHVSGQPGRDVTIVMPDGSRLKGVSLGTAPMADAGMIKITEPGKYPFSPIADSRQSDKGDWCFALGYPGGFDLERGVVCRLGRLIGVRANTVWSDCKLLGGDSGGPLFNMDGKVVGIHSRISRSIEANFHAPSGVYLQHWDTMAAGDIVPDPRQRADRPFLGVSTQTVEGGARVVRVIPASGAAIAGLQVGDIITQLDGKPVEGSDSLVMLILQNNIGDTIELTIQRGDAVVEAEATLGKFTRQRRPSPQATPETQPKP